MKLKNSYAVKRLALDSQEVNISNCSLGSCLFGVVTHREIATLVQALFSISFQCFAIFAIFRKIRNFRKNR